MHSHDLSSHVVPKNAVVSNHACLLMAILSGVLMISLSDLLCALPQVELTA